MQGWVCQELPLLLLQLPMLQQAQQEALTAAPLPAVGAAATLPWLPSTQPQQQLQQQQ